MSWDINIIHIYFVYAIKIHLKGNPAVLIALLGIITKQIEEADYALRENKKNFRENELISLVLIHIRLSVGFRAKTLQTNIIGMLPILKEMFHELTVRKDSRGGGSTTVAPSLNQWILPSSTFRLFKISLITTILFLRFCFEAF